MGVEMIQIIFQGLNLILILAVFILPFFINKKMKSYNYDKWVKLILTSTLCLVIAAFLTVLYIYSSIELSNNIILALMGFNEDGLTDFEYYQNVKPEDLIKAKEIRESQMGIGWPLKAILIFVFLIMPYQLIISTVLVIVDKKIDLK